MGRSFTELDLTGLSPGLPAIVADALESGQRRTATFESGGISVPLRILPLTSSQGGGNGAILLMDELPPGSSPGIAGERSAA
jgi:hypothetical protein